ncbi:MAG: MFS transporter [Clostridia bacterium]|nr:MFS transporter [Clostridia bacterium]
MFIKKLWNKFFALKPDREVQNKELVNYAIGVMGQNHAYNIIANWFMYFCTDVLYVDVMVVGLVLGAARIWDAINDPIVGVIVDRHTFKTGEKLRPFLKIMAIPVGIASALMFVDWGLPQKFMGLYICAIYFIWDTMYSFQDIAQWGMTAMISTNSEERGRAAQFGRIGGMVGGWLPGLIGVALANLPKFGISEKTIFLFAGLFFGFGGMCISMVAAKTKERTPVKPPEGSVKDAFKLIFTNKIAMALVVAELLGHVTFRIQDIYFFKYMVSLNLFGKTIEGLNIQFVYGLLVGLPGTLAIFIATWFARKIGGMKNLLLLSTTLNITVRIVAYFIGFEGYKIAITGALMALAGIPQGMTGIATTTIWGDSVDYMEWKTGERNEASVFALQNLVAKAGSGLDTMFTGITLSMLQFDATKYDLGEPQAPVFYKYVWLVYILGPAVGAILYLIPLLMMRYDRKTKLMVEKELRERRAQKALIAQSEEDLVPNLNLPIY